MFSSFDDPSRAALVLLVVIYYKLTPNQSHYESRHIVVAVSVIFGITKYPPPVTNKVILKGRPAAAL